MRKKPKESLISKAKDFTFAALRLAVVFIHEYLKNYYIPAALIILILVIVTGNLLTKGGTTLTLIVLGFALLHFIVKKWVENH